MGPGLGKNGGFGNYADFPLAAKWVGSFLMFAGRLELITVLFSLCHRSGREDNFLYCIFAKCVTKLKFN
jgi:hypothetical protein